MVPVGGALLVHTQTEHDATGKSYMGETGLYHMPLDGKKILNVQLKKEGPIHDVQWSPLGDEFMVIFGQSPPEACISNRKCEIVHSFGEGPRNTISYSPHGRFLCLAGFGNMSGELAFYDRKTTKCLGTVDAHMTVNYGWSPDSCMFLTAICFPRLRVDNGFRVWSLAGGLLHKEALDELTIAERRPQPASMFSAPDESDLAAAPRRRHAAPTSQAKKYVPPGQRAAGGGGGRSWPTLRRACLAAAALFSRGCDGPRWECGDQGRASSGIGTGRRQLELAQRAEAKGQARGRKEKKEERPRAPRTRRQRWTEEAGGRRRRRRGGGGRWGGDPGQGHQEDSCGGEEASSGGGAQGAQGWQ